MITKLGSLALTLIGRTSRSKSCDHTVNLYDGEGYIGSVTVVDIEGGRAKVAFRFPTNIAIVRNSIDEGEGRDQA